MTREWPIPRRTVLMYALVTFYLFALLFSFLSCTSRTSAQQAVCDQTLQQTVDKSDGDAYRWRGNRCEGIYLRPDSSRKELSIASVTEGEIDFNTQADSSKSLWVSWRSTPADGDLQIRAYSLNENIHYRMDSLLHPASKAPWKWPNEVLKRQGLLPSDVGVLAWLQGTAAKANQVFVPVRVTDKADNPKKAPIVHLVVVPGADARQLFLSVRPEQTNQRTATAFQSQPFALDFYPALVPIDIPLPTLRTEGVYSLVVGVTFTDGGTAAAPLLIRR